MNHFLEVTVTARPSKSPLRRLCRALKGFASGLERAQTRHLLGQLDDRELSDLGITRSDRLEEMEKPFWR